MLEFEELKRDITSLPETEQQLVFELVAQLKQRQLTAQSRQQLNLDQSEFVGLWKDRPELQDSSAWVKQIRQTQWHG